MNLPLLQYLLTRHLSSRSGSLKFLWCYSSFGTSDYNFYCSCSRIIIFVTVLRLKSVFVFTCYNPVFLYSISLFSLFSSEKATCYDGVIAIPKISFWPSLFFLTLSFSGPLSVTLIHDFGIGWIDWGYFNAEIESSWKDSYVLCASLEGGVGESSLYQLSRDSFSCEKIFVTSQLFLPSHF